VRQREIVTVLWFEHEFNPERPVSARELGVALDTSPGINRHIAPLRIKLRRLGWEIESSRRGYRLVEWKGRRT